MQLCLNPYKIVWFENVFLKLIFFYFLVTMTFIEFKKWAWKYYVIYNKMDINWFKLISTNIIEFIHNSNNNIKYL